MGQVRRQALERGDGLQRRLDVARHAEVAAVDVQGVRDPHLVQRTRQRLQHLARRDRVMKKLIPRFGEARLQSRGDAFTTLARSIVGQQISVKAAQAVWARLVALLESPSTRIAPAAVQGKAVGALREAGLSLRKAEYLLDLARHFSDGTVHVPQWRQMEDEAISA